MHEEGTASQRPVEGPAPTPSTGDGRRANREFWANGGGRVGCTPDSVPLADRPQTELSASALVPLVDSVERE
jgi:hypothetical protein